MSKEFDLEDLDLSEIMSKENFILAINSLVEMGLMEKLRTVEGDVKYRLTDLGERTGVFSKSLPSERN